jgi:hypothetical protein
MEGIDTLHIVLTTIAVALGIVILVGKGFLTAMKEKFMTTDERDEFLTKEDFEKECPAKQAACATQICGKIQEIRNGQEVFEKDMEDIKTDVKALETTMQTELRSIAHFIGAVEQFMVKNGYVKT